MEGSSRAAKKACVRRVPRARARARPVHVLLFIVFEGWQLRVGERSAPDRVAKNPLRQARVPSSKKRAESNRLGLSTRPGMAPAGAIPGLVDNPSRFDSARFLLLGTRACLRGFLATRSGALRSPTRSCHPSKTMNRSTCTGLALALARGTRRTHAFLAARLLPSM